MLGIGQVRGGPREEPAMARVLRAVEPRLRAAGAAVAAGMAEATAPQSKSQGDAAAAGDIRSLFAGPYQVAAMLRGEGPGRAAAWLEAIERGAGEGRLREILKGTRLEGATLQKEPSERMHAAFLRSGHQRRRMPKAVVWRQERLDRFVGAAQARVGSARKGWRDAGEDLGGRAGGWVQSGPRLGRGRVRRAGGKVRVEVTNLVPYARYLVARGVRDRVVAAVLRGGVRL